jgi:hypothetical protein
LAANAASANINAIASLDMMAPSSAPKASFIRKPRRSVVWESNLIAAVPVIAAELTP